MHVPAWQTGADNRARDAAPRFHSPSHRRASCRPTGRCAASLMDEALRPIAALGYGVCLAAMLGLLVHLRSEPHWSPAARSMAAAAALTSLWSAGALLFAVAPSAGLWSAVRWADLLRAAGWIVFPLVLLRESGAGPAARHAAPLVLLIFAAVAIGGIAGASAPLGAGGAPGMAQIGLLVSLTLAIGGLVCIEQLLRGVPPRQRWGIWPLAIALGGMFVFDLYLFSDALLLGGLDPVVWSVQGAVTACAAPLLGMAAARSRRWSEPLAVSHGAVFHSTLLLAAAVYLLSVAALGYLVRYFGGAWGPALQLVLFAAALMVLGVLLTLGSFRAKLRVLIGKNFFKRRYDYREEWLRFTRQLAAPDKTTGVHQRCIQALADLVESTGGWAWVRRQDGFRQAAQWNAPAETALEAVDGPLAAFLARTGWVIDVDECRRDPARYDGLQLPAWLEAAPRAWLVVPLVAAEGLAGFVVLMAPRVQVDVDWEVLDLLKAAGSEVAALLRLIEANHALSEAEKFAAVSRMSTFVVHDLKNLVAQLSLMLKNAERHGDNPEFRRDMLDTVRHVVERMNNMLAQARLSTRPLQNPQAVDVAAVLDAVCRGKRAQHAGLALASAEPAFALGHADRLEHVFAHLVQNAIDATPPDGHIRVSVRARAGDIAVDVVDDGVGMSTEFQQQRLFRPFQTTKPAGMGVGVYESQQYISSLGGQLQVRSAPGEGTQLRIVLPAAVPGPAPT